MERSLRTSPFTLLWQDELLANAVGQACHYLSDVCPGARRSAALNLGVAPLPTAPWHPSEVLHGFATRRRKERCRSLDVSIVYRSKPESVSIDHGSCHQLRPICDHQLQRPFPCLVPGRRSSAKLVRFQFSHPCSAALLSSCGVCVSRVIVVPLPKLRPQSIAVQEQLLLLIVQLRRGNHMTKRLSTPRCKQCSVSIAIVPNPTPSNGEKSELLCFDTVSADGRQKTTYPGNSIFSKEATSRRYSLGSRRSPASKSSGGMGQVSDHPREPSRAAKISWCSDTSIITRRSHFPQPAW